MPTTKAKEFNVASSVLKNNDSNTDINTNTDVKSQLTLQFDNTDANTFNINENQRVLHLRSSENDTEPIKVVTDELSVANIDVKTLITNIHDNVRSQKPSNYDESLGDYTSTTLDIINKAINGDNSDSDDLGKMGDVKLDQEKAIVEQAVKTVAEMQSASDAYNTRLSETVDNLKDIETKEANAREQFKVITDAFAAITGYEYPAILSIDNVAHINVLDDSNPMSNYSHSESLTLAQFLSSNQHDLTVYTENADGKIALTVKLDPVPSRVLAINDRITDEGGSKSQVYYYDRTTGQVKGQDWDTKPTLTVKTNKDGTAVNQVLESAQLVHYVCDITLTDSNGDEYKLVIMPSIETTFQYYKTDEPGAWAMDGHPVQTTASETPVVEYIVIAYEASGNPKDNAVPLFLKGLNVSGGTLSQSFAFVNVSESDDKVAIMCHEHVSNASEHQIYGCFNKLKYANASGVDIGAQYVDDDGAELYKVPSLYLSRDREILVVDTGSKLRDGISDIQGLLTTAVSEFNAKLNNTVPPLFADPNDPKIVGFTDPTYTIPSNYLQKRAELKTALGNHVTSLKDNTKLKTLKADLTRPTILNVLEDNNIVKIKTDYFGATLLTTSSTRVDSDNVNHTTISNSYPGYEWGASMTGGYRPIDVRSVTYSDTSSGDFDTDTNTYKAVLEIMTRFELYGINTDAIAATLKHASTSP
jgi:hypothetical protein